jgi:hypothetical protein
MYQPSEMARVRELIRHARAENALPVTGRWARLLELFEEIIRLFEDCPHADQRTPDVGGPVDLAFLNGLPAAVQGVPHQLKQGTNGLYAQGHGGSGTERGRVYVTNPSGSWTEDWIVTDNSAFPYVTSAVDVDYIGLSTETGSDYIASLSSGTAWKRGIMSFLYKAMPSKDWIGLHIPTGLTGTTYRLWKVLDVETSTPTAYIIGRLFRRYLGLSGSNQKFEDHWVLKQGYAMPTHDGTGVDLRVEPFSPGFQDLQAFLKEDPIPSGWTQVSSPDEQYVPYTFTVTSGVA